MVAGLAVAATWTPASAANEPAGFDTERFVTGPSLVTSSAFLPDERPLVTKKAVEIVITDPAVTPVGGTPSLAIPNVSARTRLAAVAVEGDIGNRPYSTLQAQPARLEAADASGTTTSETPVVVVSTPTPVIDVWYGTTQAFGRHGTPQQYVNILGNIANSDGVTACYILNPDPGQTTCGPGPALPVGLTVAGIDADPESPSVWPNFLDEIERRLARKGDFNVDIRFDDLDATSSDDKVRIIATTSGGSDIVDVMIEYETPTSVWPLPYSIEWSSVASIQDVAQVVDGSWGVTSAGVRPTERGYDRLIAIGDVAWDEYVIEVPITINAGGLSPFPNGSDLGGGFGILVGWQGHTDLPNFGPYDPPAWYGPPNYNPPPDYAGPCGGPATRQPKCGWAPLGVIAWYRNSANPGDPRTGQLQLFGDGNAVYDSLNDCPDSANPCIDPLQEGETYIFKLQVENSGSTNRYRLKVWPEGSAEPMDWMLDGLEATPQTDGSLALIAHHDDVTFGNVCVMPLGGSCAAFPPATVGNNVWLDLNGNGVKNLKQGDSGVSGVTVELLADDAETVLGSAVTNSKGNYKFEGLDAGTYFVRVVAPSDQVFTVQDSGATNDKKDSDVDADGLMGPIVLESGESDLLWDAGLLPPGASLGPAGKIGDLVFPDLNGNGLMNASDGEKVGVAGVTVELLASDGVTVLAERVTDGGGRYRFGVAPGSYHVRVVEPAGFDFTIKDAVGNTKDHKDSDVDPVTGVTDLITIGPGVKNLDWDAGLITEPT